ncbi:MAG: DUF3047 domain-containing protein [Rhodoferax sp.]|uniref:DUF3047 domain-containing protein n=1 Tax=Rhodoferax sp. TaxID=50421 RepID=UPI00261B8AAF|nr:DUF3047 domain-containing protein [Rhodoferax sp.]MDD2879424.1 DUF3047 domain-containing protein [Rhodoferax sp.]
MSHYAIIQSPKATLYLIAVCALCIWPRASFSQNILNASQAQQSIPALAPFASPSSSALNPAWKLTGLPRGKAPLTEFEPITLDGEGVLQLRSQASYGVLTHNWQGNTPKTLNWRWRLQLPLNAADIRTKAGDDAALKVCVMFDQPIADIPIFQRAALNLARTATEQNLPNATLCYLWDSRYPAGSRGANPYTARVRYIVLNGTETPIGQWASQSRHVSEDFALLFGQESQALPPITAIAVGADSDNTQGSSLGYLGRLHWLP